MNAPQTSMYNAVSRVQMYDPAPARRGRFFPNALVLIASTVVNCYFRPSFFVHTCTWELIFLRTIAIIEQTISESLVRFLIVFLPCHRVILTRTSVHLYREAYLRMLTRYCMQICMYIVLHCINFQFC